MTPITSTPTTIGTILEMFSKIATSLIGIFGTLAFVAFFYGLAMFLFNQDSKDMNERGKNIMMWGIIALFVMISIWGLIGMLSATFIGPSVPVNPDITIPKI